LFAAHLLVWSSYVDNNHKMTLYCSKMAEYCSKITEHSSKMTEHFNKMAYSNQRVGHGHVRDRGLVNVGSAQSVNMGSKQGCAGLIAPVG
jgi:hypothetical protein